MIAIIVKLKRHIGNIITTTHYQISKILTKKTQSKNGLLHKYKPQQQQTIQETKTQATQFQYRN